MEMHRFFAFKGILPALVFVLLAKIHTFLCLLLCCWPIILTQLLVFNDGVDSQTISIGITADQIPEINEKFSVTLTGESGGATIGTPSVGKSSVRLVQAAL